MILPDRLLKLKSIIKSIIHESWMDDDTYNEIESQIDYQKLSDDIDVGIANGHSEYYQFELIKQLFQ